MLYISVILLMHNISCGYSFLNPLERNENHQLILRHSPLFASSTSSTSTSSATNDLVVPQGILGPPEPLKSLKVGQYVNAFRQSSTEKIQIEFTIERLSASPDVYHLQNFLTSAECKEIQSMAANIPNEQAETVTKDDTTSRKHCSVSWLSSSNDDVVRDLVTSTINIFLSKEVLSHPSVGVEDLQVLQYTPGGEFVQHHDGQSRILTVIYYLNGVGGTWFPLAQTSDEVSSSRDYKPKNKMQALDIVKDLEPGKDGLLIKGGNNSEISEDAHDNVAHIKMGDALAFYNYKDNGSAEFDWNAIHCGLPTTEEDGDKLIANHWYKLNFLDEL